MECGVDITKIERFVKHIEDKNFLNKYYSKEEQEYISKKQNKAETLAGIFCAKEALLKALGMGIGAGLDLKDISVLHNTDNKPKIDITAKVFYYLEQKNCNNISISISHDGEYAIAFCVINWHKLIFVLQLCI